VPDATPAGSAPSASKNVGVRSHRARACAAGSAARPPRLRSSCPHSATKPASRCSRMARRRRRSCVRRRSTAALARVRRRCLRVCLLLCRRHARRWRSVLSSRAAVCIGQRCSALPVLQRVVLVLQRATLCRNVRSTQSRMAPKPARYPAWHGTPPRTVSHPARYPARRGIPRYPTQHGTPHGTVSCTAWYHTVSHPAWYPARHGIPHGTLIRAR
jgi:hypothetical protein